MSKVITVQQKLLTSFNRFSENVAIEVDDIKITYGDLRQSSDRISQFLSREFLNKDYGNRRPVVGLLLGKRSDIISSVVGVLNARSIFVVMDPTQPIKRLNYLVEDLEMDHLILDEQLAPLAGEITTEKTVCHFLEEIASFDLSGDSETELPSYHAEDSIYVYHTSGSTGTPKGIEGKNSSLSQFLDWETKTFKISSSDRFSQLVSPVFDAFLRDIFVPLLSGATICIPNETGQLTTPEETTQWLEEKRVSVVHCVPSVFKTFLNPDLTNSSYPHLGLILMSGEKIIPSELKPWYELFGERVLLVNLYGTTESTMIRAYYPIQQDDQDKVRIPIGKPINDTHLLILDQNLKRVDRLVTGDLYIVSDYMTKGYWKRPEANAANFQILKLDDGSEMRAFKTGDKARLLSDGNIDLLGREDSQVKILGTRIELEEIEVQMLNADHVKEAVVLVNQENGMDQICAFLVPTEKGKNLEEAAELATSHLKAILPAYMIPSKIKALENFPLLSNGKIDRKLLLGKLVERQIIAPANETEQEVLSLWKELLGDKPISTDESFLTIGGNSITLMKLIGRIYRTLKVKMGLHQLFSNLTIQEQALFIQNANRNEQFVIKAADPKASFNLSSVQERMYFEYELDRSNTAYNVPTAWKVTGEYDLNKMTGVINELTRRHESLRTEFKVIGGRVQQIIRDEVSWKVEEADIDERDFTEVLEEFAQPFDLSRAPLARCKVVTNTKGEKILLLDVHHIVCDGRSQLIILSDFEKLYRGEQLPKPQFQYKDFAEWEFRFRNSDAYMNQREFWLKKFEDEMPQLAIPSASDSLGGKDAGAKIRVDLDVEEIQSVIEQLDNSKLTLFSVTLSMYYLFLCELTGQDDIVVGVASAGRTQTELEQVVGMFVKTLPLRAKIDIHMPFSALISKVHEDFVQSHGHQSYDLANIMSELNRHRQGQSRSLFQTSINYGEYDQGLTERGEPIFESIPKERTSPKYPIMIAVKRKKHIFEVQFDYSLNYFTAEDMQMLAERFLELARKAAANPHAHLIDIIGMEPEGELLESETEDISFDF